MSESVFSPRYRAMSVGVLLSVSIVAFQVLGVGVLAGVAGTWAMLLAGRALEGLGAGALGVVTYASASRAYPPGMYGRMLALMSSAWVLPSLVGPALAGLVADVTTWRWVFVFLLPFLPVAVLLTLPGLRSLARPRPGAASRRLPQALALAAGIGLFLSELELDAPVALVALAAPALRALMPAGTLRAARGLPSGIVVRGVLAVAFLGCDAFMPLALTERVVTRRRAAQPLWLLC